jgi:hypothetical protein
LSTERTSSARPRGRRAAALSARLGRLLGAGALAAPPHAFGLRPDRLAYAYLGRDGVGRGGGGYALREQHAEELPPEGFQSGPLGGPLREPAAFAAAVGRLVARIGAPVKEASLTVPDAWLRVAFAETGQLPSRAAERAEVLRWKLKRLVPFKVDELRVDGALVAPLPSQEEPNRLLLGFALEPLLGQVEAAFRAAGVRLGRITGESLAALAALDLPPAESDGALTALALVDDDGWALLIARGGSPLLHRYKPAATAAGADAGRLVVRDLALTRNFLAEQAPGSTLERVLLLASPASEPAWREWLEAGLGVTAEPLGPAHLPPLAVAGPPPSWRDLAPLLGAVREEVT